MKYPALAAMAALMFTGAIAPSPSLAVSQPAATYALTTRIYNDEQAGELDGKLDLQVYPDGIVQGTYRDQQGLPTSVTGGLDGAKIWLNLNTGHIFNGTLEHGIIAAVAPDRRGRLIFEGTPLPR